MTFERLNVASSFFKCERLRMQLVAHTASPHAEVLNGASMSFVALDSRSPAVLYAFLACDSLYIPSGSVPL